jgi:hypothetical protein
MDDRLGRSFDDYRQRTIVRSLRYTESTIKPTLSDALANTAPKAKGRRTLWLPSLSIRRYLITASLTYVVADTSFLSFVNLR